MLKNYLKVAIRNLKKRKAYTIINILGLSIGMAVCLLILLFIQDELSFDNFHANGDRIYRVVLDRKYPGRSSSYAIIPQSIGDAIKREFPEVAASTRIFDMAGGGNFFIRIGDRIFEETQVLAVDSNFFNVFSSEFIEGNPSTALDKPNTAVINERTAKKYFGTTKGVLGKLFTTDNGSSFIVTGVSRNYPANAHFNFDILLAGSSFAPLKTINYTGFSAYTYLLLNRGASFKALESKLPLIIEKYVSPEIERGFNQTFKQFQAAGNGYHYYLQPLQKIHLISDLEAELKPNGSIRTVYVFSIIAAFILFIACINFINLSTARSVERAKEVGIRKTFGSEKRSLVVQFLMESILVSLFSIFIAIVLDLAALPVFNQMAGKELSMVFFLEPLKLLFLLLFGIIVGMAAGIYPALILSSFKPILVLKGKFKSSRYGKLLRNGLVIFQFAISVVLIICTIIVNRQMNFMLGSQLGFRKDHIIEIERSDLLGKQSKAFQDALSKINGVELVSGMSSLPGTSNFFGITFQPVGSTEPMTGRGVIVDDQYASLLGLKMNEGRFFSKEFGTDSLSVVLNERAVQELGLRKPIGSRLTTPNEDFNAPDGKQYIYTVIGVIRDFHYQSLHQKITPLVMTNSGKFGNITPLTSVRIKATDFRPALASIENVWKRFIQGNPFHFTFLEQNLADQYKSEEATQHIFTVFSVLAIIIACMGLLGLAAYSTQQRLKEISIRKVLGAGVGSIVTMLSKDFLRLIGISALLAFPVAWLAMSRWLQQFAYKVTISWWVFLVAALIASGVALFTISFQAIKAALTDPARNLRSE